MPYQFHMALLSFTDTFFFVFNKLKLCGNPEFINSIGAIFLTHVLFMLSLCHILVILTVFQTCCYYICDGGL